jgi:uncharacterized protein YrzB (UPF0473 family)
MEEETNIIEMLDEDGNILEFEHLLSFEDGEDFYIAFTPVDDMEDFKQGEVLIMKVEEDDENNDVYLPIETEEELDRLWDIFNQLYYEDEEEDGGEE